MSAENPALPEDEEDKRLMSLVASGDDDAASGVGGGLDDRHSRALVRAELAAERAGRLRAERTVAAHRGSIVRLAEVARAGWREDGAFTARGTVPIKQRR